MAGFYSLYVRDILILAIGILALAFSLAFWNFALPLFAPPSATFESSMERPPVTGTEPVREDAFNMEAVFRKEIGSVMDFKVGPLKLRHVLYGFGGLFALVIVLSAIQGLAPYVAQMRFGAGGRMLEAFEHERFDEARAMIAKGKGIHAENEFNQNPLLLALEAGKPELARMLIEAGADVNIKSKMYKTPLLVATRSRHLEMVKLLLAHGAIPDTPWDEEAPLFHALAKGYDDIARVLIEASTDLNRRYQCGRKKLTAEELAGIAKKPKLAALIRKRNGSRETLIPQLKNGINDQIQPPDSNIKEKVREKASKAEHKAIAIVDANKKTKDAPTHPVRHMDENQPEEETDKITKIRDKEVAADSEEKALTEFTGEVKEIDRDGRFIAYNNGVVEDTQTGLMWACRDNGKDIAWEEAKTYCETYKGAGYTDWRIPTMDELTMLYGTGDAYPLECNPSHTVKITRLIKLTCGYPWALGKLKTSAPSFNFRKKGRRRGPAAESKNHRALPVRKNK
ncbi:MAG: DUF1566 domain-containing protein [Deltaproteobacteria bacterium]|nr:DUF1566 domain-containing protein [Deltaproteobacteria bacterium]